MYVHKRLKASFSECPYPPDRHPFHVRIYRKDALKLGISDENKCVCTLSIVAKRLYVEESALHSSSPADTPILGDKYPFSPSASYTQDQLENFTDPISEYVDVTAFCWILEEESEVDGETDEICLECSEKFACHYQIVGDDDIYVRHLHLFPILKVVIGVTDYITFKWLQKMDFSAGMVNEVWKHDVLLKVNDTFLAPFPELFFHDKKFSTDMYYHMHVLECCPLRQGLMSVDTELVLSYIGDKTLTTPEAEFVLQSPTKAVKTLEHFLMSDFCQPLKPPSSLDLGAKTIGIKKSSFRSKTNNNLFNFELVQQHVLWRKLLCKVQKKITFDPMYIIGMSKMNMLQSGFFEESLVKVSLEMTNSTVVSYRLALVKCLSDSIAPMSAVNTVYVSPLLIFNLQNSCGMVSKKVPCNLRIEVKFIVNSMLALCEYDRLPRMHVSNSVLFILHIQNFALKVMIRFMKDFYFYVVIPIIKIHTLLVKV